MALQRIDVVLACDPPRHFAYDYVGTLPLARAAEQEARQDPPRPSG